jgi:periplasmic divalent cation tolerance protein
MPGAAIGGSRIGLTVLFVQIEEVRTTLPTIAAAEDLAAALVERRLAACVQITGPIQSVYRWHDSINKEQEFSLCCKTASGRLSHLIDYLQAHHPYELPEVLVSNVQASPKYARWLREQVDCLSPT